MSEWGRCVTHHICDCKQEELERLREEVERLRDALQGLYEAVHTTWMNDDIEAAAKEAAEALRAAREREERDG